MNLTMPQISVVLPAYNASATIAETIQSIIDQSFQDWELLIINDGSKDNSVDVINSFSDERIHLINNETNKGLIYSLNRGIDLAKGRYIARIDADDVALPFRIEKQFRYMEEHPEVIVCGTFMVKFGEESDPEVISFETNSSSIKSNYPLRPAFGHPSVMIRKAVFEETGIRYDSNYKCAEDIKLWLDLMPHGEYANLPEVLMRYRISSTQCTQSNNFVMIDNSRKCRDIYFDVQTEGWFSRNLKNRFVNIAILREFKKKFDDKNLLIGLYRSMRPYQLSVFLYSFISMDILKFSAEERKNIIKRFLNRSYSVF